MKANHKNFHKAVQVLFSNPAFLTKCAYYKTEEKARGGLEIREYWQSTKIKSLAQRGEWKGLRSIAMVQRTKTAKNGVTTKEKRYFISSLPLNVGEVALAVRGHWCIESFHWWLDVVFRADSCRVLDRVCLIIWGCCPCWCG